MSADAGCSCGRFGCTRKTLLGYWLKSGFHRVGFHARCRHVLAGCGCRFCKQARSINEHSRRWLDEFRSADSDTRRDLVIESINWVLSRS